MDNDDIQMDNDQPEVPPEIQDMMERAETGDLTEEEMLRLSDSALTICLGALQQLQGILQMLTANAHAQMEEAEEESPDLDIVSRGDAENLGLEL